MSEAPNEIHRSPEKEEAILKAALETFAEHGYHATDVQVVADRAGVGKGTVYRYFGNKDGLFQAVARSGLDRLEQEFEELIAKDVPFFDLARGLGRGYAAVYSRNPKRAAILIQEIAERRGETPDTHEITRERSRERDEALIQKGIDDGTLRPLDVRRALTVMSDAGFGVVLRAAIENRTDKLADDLAYLLELFFDGIRARSSGEA